MDAGCLPHELVVRALRVQTGHEHVDTLFLQQEEALRAAGGKRHADAIVAERVGNQLADGQFAVNDKDVSILHRVISMTARPDEP